MSTVFGLAVPYDTPTLIPGLGGEVFRGPHPFGNLATLPIVTAQLQHSVPNLLGSTASGSLRLIEKSDGLHYELDLPANDPLTAELVARGDLAGASFAFSVPPGGATWDYSAGGMAIRIISQADLYEVSLVSNPAYSTTTAMMRAEPTTAELLETASRRIARIREEDADRELGLRQIIEARLGLADRQTRFHELDRQISRLRARR
jgi:HK97 family phage prohead protease